MNYSIGSNVKFNKDHETLLKDYKYLSQLKANRYIVTVIGISPNIITYKIGDYWAPIKVRKVTFDSRIIEELNDDLINLDMMEFIE